MTKVLNFGSLNLDKVYKVEKIVAEGETISAIESKTYPGGKGLNQAIALARAGAEVYMAGGLGTDSQLLEETLSRARVNTDLLERRDCESGHAIIQVDIQGRNCIVILPGSNYGNSLEYIKSVLDHFACGDVLLLQNEIDGNNLIISEAKKRGLRIALNPSPVNKGLLDLDLQDLDFLILNEHEAVALLNNKEINPEYNLANREAYEDILQDLHIKYPNTIIVLTLGAEGSMLVTPKGKTFKQVAFKNEVVDTTAAGDTFTGFFISEIIKGGDYSGALKLASVAAGLAVGKAGAAPSIPKLEEVLAVRS